MEKQTKSGNDDAVGYNTVLGLESNARMEDPRLWEHGGSPLSQEPKEIRTDFPDEAAQAVRKLQWMLVGWE